MSGVNFAAILIVAAVALFVAAPLSERLSARGEVCRSSFELESLEHERGLAVQGLRELEFDREMGKLDDAITTTRTRARRPRALRDDRDRAHRTQADAKQASVTRLRTRPRPIFAPAPCAIPGPHCRPRRACAPAPATTASRGIRFCPQCGMRVATGY